MGHGVNTQKQLNLWHHYRRKLPINNRKNLYLTHYMTLFLYRNRSGRMYREIQVNTREGEYICLKALHDLGHSALLCSCCQPYSKRPSSAGSMIFSHHTTSDSHQC